MWFTYTQNNSYGTFDIDTDAGITVKVIIEADDHNEANDRAEKIGLYFYGGQDCPCCGYRWSEAWSDDGDEFPSLYGVPLIETEPSRFTWAGDEPEIFIHPKEGEPLAIYVRDGRYVIDAEVPVAEIEPIAALAAA